MVVLTCPNCSAGLEIEENRQFAFCQYCGTRVSNITNSIEINRSFEIENLLIRAMEFEQIGNYERAQEYCTRILDMDPSNIKAREIERRLPTYSAGPNVFIFYNSVHDDRFKLRVTLDGRNWSTLSKGESLPLKLPQGKHRIYFSGTKSYTYDLVIYDTRKPIRIIYTAEKRKNHIVCNYLT